MKEIETIYGSPPKFTQLKWPTSIKNRWSVDRAGGSSWVMMGHDVMLIPIICQVMHLITTKVIEYKTVYEFAFDLSEVNFH
jgi:hypothetical protein